VPEGSELKTDGTATCVCVYFFSSAAVEQATTPTGTIVQIPLHQQLRRTTSHVKVSRGMLSHDLTGFSHLISLRPMRVFLSPRAAASLRVADVP